MNKILDLSVISIASLSLIVSVIVGINVIESSNQNIELMKNINFLLEKELIASQERNRTIQEQYEVMSHFEVNELLQDNSIQLEKKHIVVDESTRDLTQEIFLYDAQSFSFEYVSKVPLSFQMIEAGFRENHNYELNRKCMFEDGLEVNTIQNLTKMFNYNVSETDEVKNVEFNIPILFTGTLREEVSITDSNVQTEYHRTTLGELIFPIIVTDKLSNTNKAILTHSLLFTHVTPDTSNYMEICRKNITK